MSEKKYYVVGVDYGDDCGDWYHPGDTKQETAEAWNRRAW